MKSPALAVAITLLPAALAGQAIPMAPEFQANTYTTGGQVQPAIASSGDGRFVIAWASQLQDGSDQGIFGQRFDELGARTGIEFPVNDYTTGSQFKKDVAADKDGNFVVVWSSDGQDGSGLGVFGQRFNSSGAKVGAEFQVNTFTTDDQRDPRIAADAAGNFVVVWTSVGQDLSGAGVFGQRFDASGAKAGSEFRVNTYTTSTQYYPGVALDGAGNFVVVWTSLGVDGSGMGVRGQRFDASGAKAGPEFPVNTHTIADHHGNSHAYAHHHQHAYASSHFNTGCLWPQRFSPERRPIDRLDSQQHRPAQPPAGSSEGQCCAAHFQPPSMGLILC